MRLYKQVRLCLCLIISSPIAANAQAVKHVILISIDGLRPEMYLNQSWTSPNLRKLMQQGSYANHMKSVFPSFTYPSHTSMVTGAYPATHQVDYNVPFYPTGGGDGSWNWSVKNIKGRTIWDATKDAGMKTAIVEWPVSVDAPVTWNIPEIWPVKDGEDRITESRKYSTPGLIDDIEENSTGPLTKQNMNEGNPAFDRNAGKMAAYIITKYKPNLLALHFARVDGEEHAEGPDGPNVRQALAVADSAIGDVIDAVNKAGISKNTTIIIVGDHGFSAIHEAVSPNIWLSDAGIWHQGPNYGAVFAPAGGSAFLYLQNPADTALLGKIKSLLSNLPDEYKGMFRIIEKPELTKMGADKNAVLALAAVPGIIFSGSTLGDITFTVKGGHHGYDPNLPEMYTGFIATGSGIQKGTVIPEMTVTDIAPIIMQLLKVPFNAPDGHVPANLLLSK